MDANILKKFGSFLQKTRIRKEFSQEYLAELADLDRIYISLLERGKRNPSLACVNSICTALDINLLNKLGITSQQEAFQTMLIARSTDLVANEDNRIKYNIDCKRRKCKNPDCGFIPNYPLIYFDLNSGEPLAPWIYLDKLESLLI
ncbi:MAG TPA: hypothetical protein DCF68_03580 [Cyanothece sp. UBA12306]|nr:hypothetical protein [Cyanothece sp. UBA12306]